MTLKVYSENGHIRESYKSVKPSRVLTNLHGCNMSVLPKSTWKVVGILQVKIIR